MSLQYRRRSCKDQARTGSNHFMINDPTGKGFDMKTTSKMLSTSKMVDGQNFLDVSRGAKGAEVGLAWLA